MSLSPVECDTFTVAVLPDTQEYAARNPDGLHAMTRWIVENREAQRIVFCSHVGDVVRHFNRPEEWMIAHAAMTRLDGLVPYGISVGNNDMDESNGHAGLFCSTFPAARFADQDWYGGSLRNNADSWQTFAAGRHQFLVLHLECNAPDPVLEWAGNVLETHRDHHAIVTTHMFLGPLDKPEEKGGFFTAPRGVARWSKCHGPAGNSPEQIWRKCLSRHGNLFLILCGDQSRIQTMRSELTGSRGNRVQVCLADYYGAPEGWLRLHRFRPGLRRMEVLTYGAVCQKLCTGTTLVPSAGEHSFVEDLG